jgi:hypothetical protein
MQMSDRSYRHKLSGAGLVIAGILFVLYPAIRPFSDETSLQGAAAFACTDWLVAHMLAMVAFTLLPLGFHGVFGTLRQTREENAGYWGFVLCLVGAGLTLPFYGGEAYGLHAIGQEALAQQNAELLTMAAVVRSGPGLFMFLIGLLTLAASGIVVATALWKSRQYSKWSGIPLAVGLSLYIPQFFGTQPLRVVHGLLMTTGCIWIAVALWREGRDA